MHQLTNIDDRSLSGDVKLNHGTMATLE